jgi:hypothetical protein
MRPQLFPVQLRLFPAHGFPAVWKAEARENNRLSENNCGRKILVFARKNKKTLVSISTMFSLFTCSLALNRGVF